MKTGDSAIVDDWVNSVWKKEETASIVKLIPGYKNTVLFRTSETKPAIARSAIKNHQIIVNYYSDKKCYLVYNAAIQNHIHKGKKIQISFGACVSKQLSSGINPDIIVPVYQDILGTSKNQVELVLIVGSNAIEQFCMSYKELIVPDANLIPKGKTCLYAEAGGELQKIKSTQT